jgi:hypothetical protein
MPRKLLSRLDSMRVSPPINAEPALGRPTAHRLTRYVHDCTRPSDRLVVTWFAPEIHFYAGRGQPRREQVEGASVPIILTDDGSPAQWDSRYSSERETIARHYREVWTAPTEEDGRRLRVLVDARRVPTGTYGDLGLPCYA